MTHELFESNPELQQARRAAHDAQRLANEANGWPRSSTSKRPIVDTKPRGFGVVGVEADEFIDPELLHRWCTLREAAEEKWGVVRELRRRVYRAK